MIDPAEILKDRENRKKEVCRRTANSDVITVKANIPGPDKRIGESYLITRYFTARVLQKSGGKVEQFNGADGYWTVITDFKNCDKKQTELFETEHTIGRFVDIDYYPIGASHSLSRGYLRKCYVCQKPAFVCARLKSHSTEELLTALRAGVKNFFSNELAQLLKFSLMTELNLEDKYGLVTPTSQGSHNDLNYQIMQTSQNAIIPHLVAMFWKGFYQNGEVLSELRTMGLRAEEDMYRANGGVNAYKGFIFVCGILLASFGQTISEGKHTKADIISGIKKMCAGISEELKTTQVRTFGEKAYQKYCIKGVRGNAEEGFKEIFESADLLDDEYSYNSMHAALSHIALNIDDTVLLKRSKNFENYQYFKRAIGTVKYGDINSVKILNGKCLESNISIGGCADVLASAVLFKELCSLLYL